MEKIYGESACGFDGPPTLKTVCALMIQRGDSGAATVIRGQDMTPMPEIETDPSPL